MKGKTVQMNSLTGTTSFQDSRHAEDPQGLLAGSQVRTLDGILPIEFLVPGDRILTRNGAVRLLSITHAVAHRATLVRICASSLGYDRPDTDLLVARGQRIMIRDWRAKVLFGTDVAAVPASRLVDGEFIRTEAVPIARLFTLNFDVEQVIYAEGLELACTHLATVSTR